VSLQRWHERLKHGNYSGIRKLINDKSSGINIRPSRPADEKCEGCILGKMTRGTFGPRANESKAKKVLERVYSDVCGPFPVGALVSNARYFVLFIDEYSRYIWVYLVANKSQVFSTIKQFVRECTRVAGNKIDQLITLQTDNGGEYMSSEARMFFEERGIIHQTSVAYDHEQQGMAERPNRTILEAAEAMRHHAGLPAPFWGDAVTTSVYLYNRFPHSSINYVTPFEMWHGYKPNLRHVRVFGCNAWVHRQNKHYQKLSPRAYKAVFIGYAHRQKAYRLWDPIEQKLVVSRDVIFDETQFDFGRQANCQEDTSAIDFLDLVLKGPIADCKTVVPEPDIPAPVHLNGANMFSNEIDAPQDSIEEPVNE
jgi:transposase InsO family protein